MSSPDAVDDARLLGFISDLGAIGRDPSRGDGLFRMALTDFDMAGRKWLEETATALSLQVSVDAALNIRIRLPGKDPDAAAILMGSHIDTVRNGGHLDGALGVLVGLECLARLAETVPAADRLYAAEVVAFTDEEGRFGGMLGSQCFCGTLNAETLAEMRNPEGELCTDMLRARGADPAAVFQAAIDPATVRAYVELHIEQGPVLVETSKQVGVVTGIVALWKGELTMKGQANHAGTTPFRYRKDAFLGCARLRCELEALVAAHGGCDTVATIGSVDVMPGSANVVPGECVFTIEVRDLDPVVVHRVRDVVLETAAVIAADLGLEFGHRQMSDLNPAVCDAGLVDLFAKEAATVPHRIMPSAAAHDAMNMEKITPIGMVFVPSIGGISHDPLEQTDDADIVAGASVFYRGVRRLVTGDAVPTGTPYTAGAGPTDA